MVLPSVYRAGLTINFDSYVSKLPFASGLSCLLLQLPGTPACFWTTMPPLLADDYAEQGT